MTDTPRNGALAEKMRQVVADAYGFVRGREATQSFSAVTFEDLAQQQIDRLVGKGTADRPNTRTRIQKVKEDLLSFATQIKELPPDYFKRPDAERDVNTPP